MKYGSDLLLKKKEIKQMKNIHVYSKFLDNVKKARKVRDTVRPKNVAAMASM